MSIYNKMILNEVYFQKNRIGELEECISNYRKDLWKSPGLIKKFNTHPEILKFNRLCEDIFGFKGFMLIISPSTGMVNAMTMPVSYRIDNKNPKNMIVSTNTGFRYKKEANYYTSVIVFSDLITRKDISDREVMAIILHEIGHNFQDAINNNSTNMLALKQILVFKDAVISALIGEVESLLSLVQSTNMYAKWDNNFSNKIIKKFPKIIDSLDMLKKAFSVILYIPVKVLNKVLAPLGLYFTTLSIIVDPTKVGLIMMQYEDEKIADNFPTMYGYGGDVATALTKITYKNDYIEDMIINDIPVISPIIGMYDSIIGILMHSIDCHPVLVSRLDDQINYLNKELNNCDPKVAKEIKTQIKEIESVLDQTILKSRDIKDKDLLSKVYYSFVYKLIGKGQVRDLFIGDDIHSNIQNTFNNVKIK